MGDCSRIVVSVGGLDAANTLKPKAIDVIFGSMICIKRALGLQMYTSRDNESDPEIGVDLYTIHYEHPHVTFLPAVKVTIHILTLTLTLTLSPTPSMP